MEEVDADPAGAASAVVWALMARAVHMGQGFKDGTFVLHGPRADRLLFLLLPHLHGRKSSHFQDWAAPLSEADVAAVPEGAARVRAEGLAARALGAHFGMDAGGLPAGHRHVVLGRIHMSDDSYGVYVKPEEYGCDVSSAEHVKETLLHGCSYLKSQLKRHLGDRRGHDEGLHRRKEYVLLRGRQRLQELEESLRRAAELGDAGRDCSLGAMARLLREQTRAVQEWLNQGNALLEGWQAEYGPSLDMRHGNEVLICTTDLHFVSLGSRSAASSGSISGSCLTTG